VSDYFYEYTYLGTVLRSVKESPTKWLNPANIGTALDNAVFTLDKPYLAERPAALRGRPTLCVNLNGVIISTVYDPKAKRWMTFKRPGLDLFLERISEKYEVVVWSSHGMDNAVDVVTRLDPEHRFFHDTVSKEVEKSEHEKDLIHLGRPTQRVIVLDVHENEQEQYRDNTVVVPKWYGTKEEMAEDRTLFNMIPFLEYLATQTKYYDLSKLLHAFKGYAEKNQQALPFAFLDIIGKQDQKQKKRFWDK
jgi:import inner membrane translocase subunit TIM50